MTVRKIAPRCSAVARDGRQCGRRVTDGSNPPICHIHKLHAQGLATSPLIPSPDEIDEVAILKKLARDSNSNVRLRAVDLLLSLKGNKPCPRCAATKQSELDIEKLTPDERAEFVALVTQYKEFKARVDARLKPSFLDEEPDHGPEREYTEPPRTAAAIPEPPAVERAAANVRSEPEEVAPYELPREQWDEVGLYMQNDVVTHPLGDHHAERILRGDIPFEQARDEHREVEAKSRRMAGSFAKVRTL